MDARQNTREWMVAGFCACFGITFIAVAIFYAPAPHRSHLGIALETSARIAFLFFWPAYVGGALTSLFGNLFLPLRQHGREFGLAFAAALVVHLACVFCLAALGARIPAGTLVIFGTAAVFTYLLALLSVDRVRRALPSKMWAPIRGVAMNYIALAFILDFVKFPLYGFYEVMKYLPFAALAIVGPALKIVAFAKNNLRHMPIGGASRP